jgi:hypothetical protein
MKRDDEEFCRKAFSAYLSSVSPSLSQVWAAIEQSEEPPDYELNLGGTDYAVEVTTLMEKVQVGNLHLPPIGITNSLWSIVRKIEQHAIDQGKLHGAYYVCFLHSIPNLAAIQEALEKFLFDYFEKTFAKDRAEQAELRIGFQHICFVAKVFNSETFVNIGGPVFAKWEGESSLPICSILQEAIEDKSRKLRMIDQPKILLLLDMYSFASNSAIKECVSVLSGLDAFHSIFITKPSGNHLMLKSENPVWMSDISG